MSSPLEQTMDLKIPQCVGLYYKIKERIGKGSFGVIYRAESYKHAGDVAVKFEQRDASSPQLRSEYKVYKILAGVPGIPRVYYFGQEEHHNILVMDLLGPDIESVFKEHSRSFPAPTVCLIALQMLEIVEQVHERGLIYRDMKPDNFVFDAARRKIHLIDFGMAKYYWCSKRNEHIPYRECKPLTGTARYMSVRTHNGAEQSRRDDIEALGHVIGYLFEGRLPWQGLNTPHKNKYTQIAHVKCTTPLKDAFRKSPQEIVAYLEYAREMGFTERPDYAYLKRLFSTVLCRYPPEERTLFWSKELPLIEAITLEEKPVEQKRSAWKPWKICR
ncbi:MAG: casein kinase I [Amphiamblys sp. WSBS2006]|nr:MAG: casein kinase I [Amphiamblys sp. WSBS2006]